jgi:hypothetical protein
MLPCGCQQADCYASASLATEVTSTHTHPLFLRSRNKVEHSYAIVPERDENTSRPLMAPPTADPDSRRSAMPLSSELLPPRSWVLEAFYGETSILRNPGRCDNAGYRHPGENSIICWPKSKRSRRVLGRWGALRSWDVERKPDLLNATLRHAIMPCRDVTQILTGCH